MFKNIINIISKIVIVMLIIQTMYLPISNAATSLTDVITSGENFIQNGKEQGDAINTSKLKSTTDMIYNILISLGVVLSVIVGAILGIQIMWGSIEQKTKAKEALMPYVIGCIVIFGAFGIWKLCIMVFAQL